LRRNENRIAASRACDFSLATLKSDKTAHAFCVRHEREGLFMRKFHRHALSASLILLAGAANAQSTDQGWYIGIGVGDSNYSGDLPQQTAAAYRNNSTYTLQSARVIDSSDTAAQVFVGYRFLPWLGAEVGYQDMGNARTFYSLKTNGPIIYPLSTLTGEYGLRGANAALVATWPVGDRFELLARAGISNTRLTYDEHGFDVTAKPYSFHARTRTHSAGTAGIGAQWNFSRSFALRLDLDRNFEIGKKFALNVVGNGQFDHVDVYTVNLVWKP
jgi:opacity protein-like surface antigen